ETITRAVEGVGRRVRPDEALAGPDGVQQGLLPLGRHRRRPIGAGLGEVAGGVEEEGVVCVQAGGGEDAPVFRRRDVEAVLLAEVGYDLFGKGRAGILLFLPGLLY